MQATSSITRFQRQQQQIYLACLRKRPSRQGEGKGTAAVAYTLAGEQLEAGVGRLTRPR